jgi:20S proteasome subunit alpha 1
MFLLSTGLIPPSPNQRLAVASVNVVCVAWPFNQSPTRIPLAAQATAAGVKEQEAVNNLEKKFKHGGPSTLDETLDVAITSLQAVLSSDFKPDEVEIAVAELSTEGAPVFRKLTLSEIEHHLTRIAERD